MNSGLAPPVSSGEWMRALQFGEPAALQIAAELAMRGDCQSLEALLAIGDAASPSPAVRSFRGDHGAVVSLATQADPRILQQTHRPLGELVPFSLPRAVATALSRRQLEGKGIVSDSYPRSDLPRSRNVNIPDKDAFDDGERSLLQAALRFWPETNTAGRDALLGELFSWIDSPDLCRQLRAEAGTGGARTLAAGMARSRRLLPTGADEHKDPAPVTCISVALRQGHARSALDLTRLLLEAGDAGATKSLCGAIQTIGLGKMMEGSCILANRLPVGEDPIGPRARAVLDLLDTWDCEVGSPQASCARMRVLSLYLLNSHSVYRSDWNEEVVDRLVNGCRALSHGLTGRRDLRSVAAEVDRQSQGPLYSNPRELLCNLATDALQTHCVPVLQALASVMLHWSDEAGSGMEGNDALLHLSRLPEYAAVRPKRFNDCLGLLEEHGFPISGPIQRKVRGQKGEFATATLLHYLAELSHPDAISLMHVALLRGCDSEARDSRNRTVAGALPSNRRGSWKQLIASANASAEAALALNEIQQRP